MSERDAQTRILEATRQEIAESGVRGLRVQQVAKRAGVSLGLVYYHFTDRAGLLNATIDAVNKAVQERETPPHAGLSATETIVQLLVEEFGDEGTTRADSVVWNEIRAIAVFETELQGSLAEVTHDWEARLAGPLARVGVPEGEIRIIATLLTSLVEGISSRWLTGQLDTAAAQQLMRAGTTAILSHTT